MAERAHPNTFKDKWFGLVKNIYRQNLFERYQMCNEFIANKVVLDIPCGMGWGSSLLAGYAKLVGIDLDPPAIIEAQQRYPGIDFRVGNMTRIDSPDASFDTVICLEGFEHITFLEGQDFLKEARRVLKPAGQLILTTPLLKDGKYHSGNRYHLCEYREEELYQILDHFKFKVTQKRHLTTKSFSIIWLLLTKE